MRIAAGAELERDTGRHHIVAVAERRTEVEERVLVRMVVRCDGRGVLAAVVAVADGEVPLVLRIVVLRMETGKSGSARADFLDVIRQGLLDALNLVNAGNLLPISGYHATK